MDKLSAMCIYYLRSGGPGGGRGLRRVRVQAARGHEHQRVPDAVPRDRAGRRRGRAHRRHGLHARQQPLQQARLCQPGHNTPSQV